MKVLLIDSSSGISGDMLLAALINTGIDLNFLQGELKKVNVGGFDFISEEVKRNAISALRIKIKMHEENKKHRSLKDIFDLISDNNLSPKIQDLALKVFYNIAQAEATVHNEDISKVHFHEVGRLESILNVIGIMICINEINPKKIFSTPIRVGSNGFIKTEHGTLPLPAPATIEILKNYPIIITDQRHEITTPTGAAIVKSISSGIIKESEIEIVKIGYGCGTIEIPDSPNFLRVFIGNA